MSVKIITREERTSVVRRNVQLDTSRKTAILIRQSGRGANVKHYESRLLQEALIPMVMEAREDTDLSNILVYDEGAGVSGSKGITKRKKLFQMHVDIASGLIGDIVLARVDRLFRDKHFENVSAFTTLAERMRIKVIVWGGKGCIVYDMTNTKDLQNFQRDMQVAYSYIDVQVGYMNRARDGKRARGLYGGGNMPLPFVLLKGAEKDEQRAVIYEPWKKCALDLFEKYREFGYENGRLMRYVESLRYLFPFMPEEDKKTYLVLTKLTKVEGGYTFTSPHRLLDYMSNLMLAGYLASGKDDEGNTLYIENGCDEVIPREQFEPAYCHITGQYIDGQPYQEQKGNRQFRRTETEADAMLHGFLTSDDGMVSVFNPTRDPFSVYTCFRSGYLGQAYRIGLGRQVRAWTLVSPEVDSIVLDRLIALIEYDESKIEAIRAYFASIDSNSAKLQVLDTAIEKTQATLDRQSRTIALMTKEDDQDGKQAIELDESSPIIKEFRKTATALRDLQQQRKKVAVTSQENPTKTIENFYEVLANLRHLFTEQLPQIKKDIIRKLVEEVRINVISQHLFLLTIKWMQPIACKEDVCIMWRSRPVPGDDWTDEESELLRTLYPDKTRSELLQAFPTKTQGQLKKQARQIGVRRQVIDTNVMYCWNITYTDLMAAYEVACTQYGTVNDETKDALFQQVNMLAETTRKWELKPLWFHDVACIAFSCAVEDTSINGDRCWKILGLWS